MPLWPDDLRGILGRRVDVGILLCVNGRAVFQCQRRITLLRQQQLLGVLVWQFSHLCGAVCQRKELMEMVRARIIAQELVIGLGHAMMNELDCVFAHGHLGEDFVCNDKRLEISP